MLITTYAGLVVNSDHIAYIALKRCETTVHDEPTSPTPSTGALHKVLLFLGTGDQIVAATELSTATAQRLRQLLAQHWAEGLSAFDVNTMLQRLCDSGTTPAQTKVALTKGDN